MHVVKADVVIDGSTIFVILSATEKWPFVIENDSDFSVSMIQWVCFPKSHLKYALNVDTVGSQSWRC